MSPIELVFIVLVLTFGVIGIVRGSARELGVTIMLLVALLVLQLMDTMFKAKLTETLNQVFGISTAAVPIVLAVFKCGFLILIVFISYQGRSITFPARSNLWFFSMGIGLINGYLFAGSIWYYLQKAGWPLLNAILKPDYGLLNQSIIELMPPAIFNWKVILLMAVFMLIMRVWK